MFDRNLMKLPGMPAIMAALLVLALLQAAAVFGQVWFLAGALSMLWEGIALEQALPNVACFFACFALLNLLRFGQETMLDRFSQRRAESLRDELLSATFDDEALLAVRQGAARVSTMLGSGIDEVQTYVRIIPPKIVGMVAVSIPLLVAVFAIDWVSGVILAVMFPVIIFFMILLGKQAAARAERQYGAYTRLSNRFIDTLRGLHKLGLDVPRDVLLSGFDDSSESRSWMPSFTTIHIHTQSMAYNAMELLTSRMLEPTLEYRRVYTQTDLIYRQSTERN